MKKNINRTIRTGIFVAAGLVVSYACSDTWDEHYDANLATGNVVDATIYQQLTGELSDFREIIDKTGYASLLDESQLVTVFAPVNGSFNKDSLLLEIANGHKDQVITRFVKNHIARYNYSSNAEKQDIMLLNQKKTSLTNGVVGVDSVRAKSVNTVCTNGILHVLNSELTFHPNIYELFELDPDIDSMYNIIKYYDDDSDIVSECDQIADDLLFKAIGRNERTLELPVSSSYIKNYCLSSNISNNQLFDSLVWIALRLVAINYCIRFNNSLEENNED